MAREHRPSHSEKHPAPRLKRSAARVTRVVDELLVFIAVDDEGEPLCLVFKPDKIDRYDGSALWTLGIKVGAKLPEVVWNPDTLKVHSVRVDHLTGSEPLSMRSA